MLNKLSPSIGSRKKSKRVGRGPGCNGKTSCRGHKGQRSRSGGKVSRWFEGGQTPLKLRSPKRGFTNIFKTKFDLININDLSTFKDGQTVTPEELLQAGLTTGKNKIKLLGSGEVKAKLVVQVHAASKSATKKLDKAGGKIEII